MDTSIQQGAKAAPSKNDSLVVKVRYLAARQQFVDPKAQANETLAELKPRVLAFFELSEGAVNGGTKIYQFVHGTQVQTDLNVTLGSIGDRNRDLELMLIEQFEQG